MVYAVREQEGKGGWSQNSGQEGVYVVHVLQEVTLGRVALLSPVSWLVQEDIGWILLILCRYIVLLA